MEFYIDIANTATDYTNAINTITEFCIQSDDSEIIYSFHPSGFPYEDTDDVVILRGEYELMMSIINVAAKNVSEINEIKVVRQWDGYNHDHYHTYRTAIIQSLSNYNQSVLTQESSGEAS